MSRQEQLDVVEARGKILATATELFAKQGYESTSLSQVAREAKVSKALIFWHFDSKEELYRNALQRTLEPYFIKVELAGLNERQQVEHLIDQFYDFIHDNVYSVRFFLNLALRDEQQPDESLSRVTALHGIFRNSLANIIESGQRRGVFRSDVEAGPEAGLIMAALGGILIQQFLSDPSSNEPVVLKEHLKRSLFQRLCPSDAGGTPAGRPE